MAKKTTGTFKVPGGFEVNNNKPIDDRFVVETDADLLVNTNADGTLKTSELYKGIIVYSQESETHFVWNGLDRTDSDNWVNIQVNITEKIFRVNLEQIQATSLNDNIPDKIINYAQANSIEKTYNEFHTWVVDDEIHLSMPSKIDWLVEYSTWSSQDLNGAFNSVLKLTANGRRSGSDGSMSPGTTGYYHSTDTNFENYYFLVITTSNANHNAGQRRSSASAIRLYVNGLFTQSDYDNYYQNKTIKIDDLDYGFVYNSATQKIWLDRNLGATQVATSSTDINAYGDLYQWGRKKDGHEKRNSLTYPIDSILPDTVNDSGPWDGKFILNTRNDQNWLNPPYDNTLWQEDVYLFIKQSSKRQIFKINNQPLGNYNNLKTNNFVYLNNINEQATENPTATGTVNLDLSTFESQKLNLTGNTTITVSNTPAVGKTKVINLAITTANNTETLTLPGTWNVYGEFDPAVRNKLSIEFANFATSGLEVDCFINQPT